MERRKHKRYLASQDALVFCLERYGNVIDISEGGMAINIIENSRPLPDKWETCFYCKDKGTLIEVLPLKTVRKGAIEFSPFGLTEQTIGAKFDNPTALQQEQIRRLLYGCDIF